MPPGLLERLWYFDICVRNSKGRSNGPALSLGRGEGESLLVLPVSSTECRGKWCISCGSHGRELLEPFDMPKKRDETFAEKVCVGWMSRKSNIMDRWSING